MLQGSHMTDSSPNPVRHLYSVKARWTGLGVLLVLVGIVWCTHYERWSREAWGVPTVYGGDGWATLAFAKAFSNGDALPIVSKINPSLGAPFRANWNDYPTVEEGLFVWEGLLVRIFGLFCGTNLALLSAALLAATSFYFVCLYLQYNIFLSLAGASLFALSRYLFYRGIMHLSLTYYWHVPLGLLVAWFCLTDVNLGQHRKKLLFCVAVAVLHGIQNVYYSWMFLQLLGLATLIRVLRQRSWSSLFPPVFVGSTLVATFIVMNCDTFYYGLMHKGNSAAVVRSFSGLEVYSLKPLELAIPNVHSFIAFRSWANNAYYGRALFLGEAGSAYLGIVGLFGLGLLLWRVMKGVSKKSFDDIPSHLWGLLWVFAYSVLGGLNAVLGLMGLVLFRGSNRFSIVLLAIILLYLVRSLTFLTQRWKSQRVLVAAASLATLGIWDQVPPRESYRNPQNIRPFTEGDRQMVATIEGQLPRKAMVFELPVMEFPEVPPTLGVGDYEHFRPYLYSHALRFSYGDDKGRFRTRWQSEAANLPGSAMVDVLERYGFSALLINRKGYVDKADSIADNLNSSGKTSLIYSSPEFLCFRLQPSPHPLLPPLFDEQWCGLEGTPDQNHRWSMGNAGLTVFNKGKTKESVQLTFGLRALRAQHISVSLNSTRIFETSLAANSPIVPVALTVTLLPGDNNFLFESDHPAEEPGNGDPRKLAFDVTNFQFKD
jgi:phosphoglycerol transferase